MAQVIVRRATRKGKLPLAPHEAAFGEVSLPRIPVSLNFASRELNPGLPGHVTAAYFTLSDSDAIAAD